MSNWYSGSGDRNSNYCSRVQNVFFVVTVTTLSAHFAGCNLSNLSGCTDPMPFYKSSTSLIAFYFFSSIFERSFVNISWKVSEFVAFTFALLYYFYAPLNFHVYTVEVVKYFALFWLSIQGLIIIDIAHESHLYIVKRAELAFNFRGIQASKPWYLLHMVLSAALFLIAASLLNLVNSQCGYCVENKVVISLITCAALLSIYFSLMEQCNKGGLIPSIVFCYSVLICSNALWSNPNTVCNSSTPDVQMYRITAKVTGSWLLLLTALTSAIYTAVTGSTSVLLIYKSLRSIAARKTSTSISRNNCISSGTCCNPILGDDKHFEETLGNDPESSLPLAYFENHSHTIMAGDVEVSSYCASEQGYSSSFTGSSVLHLDRCPPGIHIAGASSSGTGSDLAGESTSLLRDHRLLLMSTDPDFVPCSSVSADDLLSDNSILFKTQMGLAACYFCVILSDWNASNRNDWSPKGAQKSALIMKLIGSFFVWIVYAFVLLNSYVIYRQYNMKLRDLIRT
jgi:hypothetical protein